MEFVLLAARVSLALVFAVAAVGKLMDLSGSRAAAAGFGLPSSLAVPVGTALPFIELAVALALIPLSTAVFGAAGGLVLLLAFIAAIAVNLARDNHPDCHCFGSVHSEPASWRTLARNAVLALIAAFILWRGWENAGESIVDLGAAEATALLLGFAAFGLGVLSTWLYQENRALRGRIVTLEAGETTAEANQPALVAGSPAPEFQLADLSGTATSLESLRSLGKPVLLVFSSPHCFSCKALMPHIANWQRDLSNELTIAVVSDESIEENRRKADEHGLMRVLVQSDREATDAYDVASTPSAIVVNPDGTLASELVGGEAILELITRTLGHPISSTSNGKNGHRTMPIPDAPVAPAVGDPAPPLVLLDPDEGIVDLAHFRGEAVLLLFWKPDCKFSQRMLRDITKWVQGRAASSPQLIVVSDGDIEAIRAADFQSPVAIDTGFHVARTFGVRGTPAAVLVDGEGRIASTIVVGGSAVMSLARTPVEATGAIV